MSLHVLVVGVLTADPQRRTNAAGKSFAIGTIRAATDDGPVLISTIAFGDQTTQLLAHQRGQALALSGRAKLTSWTAKDGTEKHGVSVVAEQIASAASARRADVDRRRERNEVRQ
jgi:single-stranded DNA-binding protein